MTFCESKYYQDTCAYIFDRACLMHVFLCMFFTFLPNYDDEAIAINQILYSKPKSNDQDRLDLPNFMSLISE